MLRDGASFWILAKSENLYISSNFLSKLFTYTGHIKTEKLISFSIAYMQCSKLEARIHSAHKLHLPADLSSFIVNKFPRLLATNSNIYIEESVKIEDYLPLCLGSSVFMPETR